MFYVIDFNPLNILIDIYTMKQLNGCPAWMCTTTSFTILVTKKIIKYKNLKMHANFQQYGFSDSAFSFFFVPLFFFLKLIHLFRMQHMDQKRE